MSLILINALQNIVESNIFAHGVLLPALWKFIFLWISKILGVEMNRLTNWQLLDTLLVLWLPWAQDCQSDYLSRSCPFCFLHGSSGSYRAVTPAVVAGQSPGGELLAIATSNNLHLIGDRSCLCKYHTFNAILNNLTPWHKTTHNKSAGVALWWTVCNHSGDAVRV